MADLEEEAEKYVLSKIPLGHVRTDSDCFQPVQKEAHLAGQKIGRKAALEEVYEWASQQRSYKYPNLKYWIEGKLTELTYNSNGNS